MASPYCKPGTGSASQDRQVAQQSAGTPGSAPAAWLGLTHLAGARRWQLLSGVWRQSCAQRSARGVSGSVLKLHFSPRCSRSCTAWPAGSAQGPDLALGQVRSGSFRGSPRSHAPCWHGDLADPARNIVAEAGSSGHLPEGTVKQGVDFSSQRTCRHWTGMQTGAQRPHAPSCRQ